MSIKKPFYRTKIPAFESRLSLHIICQYIFHKPTAKEKKNETKRREEIQDRSSLTPNITHTFSSSFLHFVHFVAPLPSHLHSNRTRKMKRKRSGKKEKEKRNTVKRKCEQQKSKAPAQSNKWGMIALIRYHYVRDKDIVWAITTMKIKEKRFFIQKRRKKKKKQRKETKKAKSFIAPFHRPYAEPECVP